MQLRRWQKEIIDDFQSILDSHRRFIIKAPTGAAKTKSLSCNPIIA